MKIFFIILIIFSIILGSFYPTGAKANIDITPNQYIAKVDEEIILNYLANYYVDDASSYTNCRIILDKAKYFNLSKSKQKNILPSLVPNCPALGKVGSPASLEKIAKQLNVPYSNPLYIETDISSLVNGYNVIKREMLKNTLGLEGLPDETVDSIENEMCNLFLSEFLGFPISIDEISVLNSEPLMNRPYLYGRKFRDYLTKNPDSDIKSQLSTNILEKLYSPKGYLTNYLENKNEKSFSEDEINILKYPPGWETDAFIFGLNIFLMTIPIVGSLTSREAIQTVKPFVKNPAVMEQLIKPFSKFITEDLPKFRSYLSNFIENLKNPKLQSWLSTFRDPYFDRENLILAQKNALNSYAGLVDNIEKSTQIKLLGKMDRVLPNENLVIQIFDNNNNKLGDVPLVFEPRQLGDMNIKAIESSLIPETSILGIQRSYSILTPVYGEIYDKMLGYLPSLNKTSAVNLLEEIRFVPSGLIRRFNPDCFAVYYSEEKILLLPYNKFMTNGIIDYQTFSTAIHEIIHQIRFSNNINLSYISSPMIEEAITEYQTKIIFQSLRDKIKLEDQMLILPKDYIPKSPYDENVQFLKKIINTIQETITNTLINSGEDKVAASTITQQLVDRYIWGDRAGGTENLINPKDLKDIENIMAENMTIRKSIFGEGKTLPITQIQEMEAKKIEVIQEVKDNAENLVKSGTFDNTTIANELPNFALKTNFENPIPDSPIINSSKYFISDNNELVIDLNWQGPKFTGQFRSLKYTDFNFILDDSLGNILYITESNYFKLSVLNKGGDITVKIPLEKLKSLGNGEYKLSLSAFDQVLGPDSSGSTDKLQLRFSKPAEITIDMSKVNQMIQQKFNTNSNSLLLNFL